MITLLGGTGYVGQAFEKALQQRGLPFETLRRSRVDYTRFDVFLKYLREAKPEFVVNAAGYTGKPNVDACELHKSETLFGNTLFPAAVAQACMVSGTPWGHVSSGCIYAGAKISEGGKIRVEKDLMQTQVQDSLKSGKASLIGFTEQDEPNFSFRNPPYSFYSGTKALGEEAVAVNPNTYLWRLRIPFDEIDNPRNYLTKVQKYAKVYDNINSISHRADFVNACLDLWKVRAPFGIYNVTNPGHVSTRQVVDLLQKKLKTSQKFEFWASDEEFYKVAAKTPRSNCVMDPSKLLTAGVKIRPVQEALEDSFNRWQAAS